MGDESEVVWSCVSFCVWEIRFVIRVITSYVVNESLMRLQTKRSTVCVYRRYQIVCFHIP